MDAGLMCAVKKCVVSVNELTAYHVVYHKFRTGSYTYMNVHIYVRMYVRTYMYACTNVLQMYSTVYYYNHKTMIGS